MSKSLGTIVDPLDAAERFGPDPLRLYLAKEVPYGGDGDFTWERFEERYNADLANNLGNLVSRVAAMARAVPAGAPAGRRRRAAGVAAVVADGAVAAYREAMDRLRAARGRGRGVPAGRAPPTSSSREPARGRSPRIRPRGRRLTRRALRRRRGGARRRRAAAAGHAGRRPPRSCGGSATRPPGRGAAARATPRGDRGDAPSDQQQPGRCGPASKTREPPVVSETPMPEARAAGAGRRRPPRRPPPVAASARRQPRPTRPATAASPSTTS